MLCFVLSNKGRWKIEFGLCTTTPGEERLNPSTGEKLMLSLESLIINISLQLFSLTFVSFLTSEQSLFTNLRCALPISAASRVPAASPLTLLYESPFSLVLLPPGNRYPLVLNASNKRQVPVSASWRCLPRVGVRRGQDRIISIFLDTSFIGNTSVAFPELLMEN